AFSRNATEDVPAFSRNATEGVPYRRGPPPGGGPAGRPAGGLQVGLVVDVEEVAHLLEAGPLPEVPLVVLLVPRRDVERRDVDLGVDVEAAAEHGQVELGVEVLVEVGAAVVESQPQVASQAQLDVDQPELAADAGAGDDDVHAELGVGPGV